MNFLKKVLGTVLLSGLFCLALNSQASAKEVSIVLVHGAYADGSSWSKVIPLLQAQGYHVIAVQNPLTSLYDDVAATARAIENIPGKVVLVGHSWAGAVITTVGYKKNVAALVYVASLAPSEGDSFLSLMASQAPTPGTTHTVADRFGFLTLTAQGMAEDFAPDLTSAEAKVMAITQGPASLKAFGTKVSVASWRTKPSWAIIADQDRMISPTLEASSAQKINAHVTHLNSSHVPMLSHPDQVAAVILDAAHQVENQ